jgi:mannose-1-phosphate guanylyltransferase
LKALLLAAGLGSRLRPITDTIPKCLVPINGKPLLQYWLENLTKVGVDKFIINTSYLSEQVNDFIKNSIYRDSVELVYEDKLLNTGGTLLANKKSFADEPFMLIHADNLTLCDFEPFIKRHINRPKYCDITMMLFRSDTPQSCGIVELDSSGVVNKFHEKVKNPPSNLANGAVYICEPTIFNFLEELKKDDIDFSNDVIPKYMGRINTFINDRYHRDIGNVESYALAQVEVLEYV